MEIFIETVSHSKRKLRHPDKSAEAGTLDSSNEDEMPIFNAILAYLVQLCKTKQNSV